MCQTETWSKDSGQVGQTDMEPQQDHVPDSLRRTPTQDALLLSTRRSNMQVVVPERQPGYDACKLGLGLRCQFAGGAFMCPASVIRTHPASKYCRLAATVYIT